LPTCHDSMEDNVRLIVTRVAMCCLAFCSLLIGVSAAQNDDAASLKDRLRTATKATSLNDDDVEPYYLKIDVQLYDEKGKPGEQGTVEEWWAGAGKDKRVYTMPSYTATVVSEDGKTFRTPNVSYPPVTVELLRNQVIHPMPEESELEAIQPQVKKITFGKVPLECIMLAQPIKGLKTVPMGLFPTYCFDPGKDSLRATFNFGTQFTVRNSIATFQQKIVSTDISVSAGTVMVAKGHVAVLRKQAVTEADLTTDSLVQIGNGVPAQVASGVISGMLLKKTEPIYPQSATENHVSGVVVLRALIGTDGHVNRLTVQSSTDPDLAIAALAAVRQWTYKPYTLNGMPTDVETTINVKFDFR